MSNLTNERVEAARLGKNPTVVCRMPSGWVFLADMQYLHGYAVLTADPIVSSLNDLQPQKRAQYLCDMAVVGDALLEVTGAYRINYAIMGNTDPILHAHIIPRYADEPDKYRNNQPWAYPEKVKDGTPFDYEREKVFIAQLAQAIQKRMEIEEAIK